MKNTLLKLSTLSLLLLAADAVAAGEQGNFRTEADKKQTLGYLQSTSDEVTEIHVYIEPHTTDEAGKPSEEAPGELIVKPAVSIITFDSEGLMLNEENIKLLEEYANYLKTQHGMVLKVISHAHSDDDDLAKSRRMALQRAIQVRKQLLDFDLSPDNISIDAAEDMIKKSNEVNLVITEFK